ncbi:MAG: hypothetical protein P0111_08155 [Nitrospira sp.]|nr:hypothetical protein [Nitrospira sp.]
MKPRSRTLGTVLLAALMTAQPAIAATPVPSDNPCQSCAFGPVELAINKFTPRSFHYQFKADPQDEYTLVIEQLGRTALQALVLLNGEIVSSFRQPISHGEPHVSPVTLRAFNNFHVVLKGLETGRVRIAIVRTSSLPLSRRACGERTKFFTHYPVDPDLLRGAVPLGNLDPPAHTLPTHHIYLSPTLSLPSDPTSLPSVVDVHAPGRVEVVAVTRNGPDDFDVHMQPCREVRSYFFHLRSLDSAVAAALRPDRWVCFAGSIDEGTCAQRISVTIDGGQRIGNAPAPRAVNFDWGLIDRRRSPLPFANPARYDFSLIDTSGFPPDVVAIAPYIAPERLQQFCPAEYLTAPLVPGFSSLFGSADGRVRRTAPPVCGEHEQDQPGTARGNWFTSASASAFDEGRTTLALVHDNVNPVAPVFSVSGVFCTPLPTGGEICQWSPGVRGFPRATTGLINRDFADIAIGPVYCFENLRSHPGDEPDLEIGRVLVEVFASTPGGSADRLRIEPIPATVATGCGPGPWSFGSGMREFQR